MENIRNLSNKKVVITSILIFILILAIAFTYAIWTSNFTQTGENVSNYDCFDITFSENNGSGFTLSNQIPITDAQGLQNSYYSVTIKNTCNIGASYNVVLNKMNSSTLADSHVKIAVNSNVSLLSNLPSVKTSLSSASSARNIYSGVLSARGTATIKIQSWMDENTSKEDGSNKSFTYKITIDAQTSKNLLADKVLENKVITSVPDFLVGEPPSNGTNTGSGLYRTSDDDGATYYFRGDVKNNYVSFANQLWQIIRINGDGSIRLIKSESIGDSKFNEQTELSKYVGFTYDNASACTQESPCISSYNTGSKTFTNSKTVTNSIVKTYLENWYKNNLSSYDSKIALTKFCNDTTTDDSSSNSKAYNRMVNGAPSLTCQDTSETFGGLYKLKIGLINADEMLMAGASWTDPAKANYLEYNSQTWSLTPATISNGSYAAGLRGDYGNLSFYVADINGAYAIRPVINLNASTQISSGNGSESNPFVVK